MQIISAKPGTNRERTPMYHLDLKDKITPLVLTITLNKSSPIRKLAIKILILYSSSFLVSLILVPLSDNLYSLKETLPVFTKFFIIF